MFFVTLESSCVLLLGNAYQVLATRSGNAYLDLAFQEVATALLPGMCNSTTACTADLKECIFSPSRLKRVFTCRNGKLQKISCAESHWGPLTKWSIALDCSGSLAPAIGKLATLERLHVTGCSPTPLPSQLGNLERIDALVFVGCCARGSIPSFLGRLPALRIWTIRMRRDHSRSLTGTIPPELAFSAGLTEIRVLYTALAGPIPTQFGRLTLLRLVRLFDNLLTGSIPSQLGRLTGITQLMFLWNCFSGSVPAAVVARPIEIALIGSRMEGTIPWDAIHDKVRDFAFGNSRMEGTIAPGIGKLRHVVQVRLSEASLTGAIPSALGDLQNLRSWVCNGNYLTGSVPEDFSRLRMAHEIVVSDNHLQGSIPHGIVLPQLNVMLLHANRLTGTIPRHLQNLRWLMLSLHDNLLEGLVPSFVLTGTGEFSSKPPLLTMSGNRLSCELPEVQIHFTQISSSFKHLDINGPSVPNVTLFIVPGNHFSPPVPKWLPTAHKDARLFSDDRTVPFLYVFLFLYSSAQALALLMWQRCHEQADWAHVSPHVTAALSNVRFSYHLHCRFLMRGGLFMLVSLLPVYYAMGHYYVCNATLFLTSAAYLNSPPGEGLLIGIIWCFFGFMAECYVHALCENRSGFSQDYSSRRWLCLKVVQWCVYIPIVVVFGFPGLVYAISKSVPERNIVSSHMGQTYFWCSKFAPVVMYLSDLLLAKLAKWYSKFTLLKYLQLRCFALTMKWNVMPVLVTAFLHENCLGAWRLLSTDCRESDSYDINMSVFPFSAAISVMRTSDVCKIRSFQQIRQRARCTRSVVEALTPLFLQKALLAGALRPMQKVISWLLWKRGWISWNPLRSQLVEIVLWCQMAVIWGPFVPMLLPMIFVSAVFNFHAFQFCTMYFGSGKMDKIRLASLAPIQSLLLNLPASSMFGLIVFSLENRLHSGITSACGLFLLLVRRASTEGWFARFSARYVDADVNVASTQGPAMLTEPVMHEIEMTNLGIVSDVTTALTKLETNTFWLPQTGAG